MPVHVLCFACLQGVAQSSSDITFHLGFRAQNIHTLAIITRVLQERLIFQATVKDERFYSY